MSVFIQAHQDDWQYNMGSNAYDDLESIHDGSDARMLFIYVTAGDADARDSGLYGQARERGARASVRVLLNNLAGYKHDEALVQRTYHGHLIDCVTIGNVTSVFLRLPDSSSSALQSLKNGNSVSSIGPTIEIYANWSDLVATMIAIVEDAGLDGSDTLWFNAIADGDTAGHVDHQFTAQIVGEVQSAVAGNHPDKKVNLAWWQGTKRLVTQPDDGILRRAAAILPYEGVMFGYDIKGTSNTLYEPVVVSRMLLLQQIRA
jgi:hypothetical protein